MTDIRDWLQKLPETLSDGRRSAGLVVALAETLAIADDPSAAWVDATSSESTTVYILERGLLHRVAGQLELPTDAAGVSATREASYRVATITHDASYSLAIMWQSDAAERTLARTWSFEVAGFEPFKVSPAAGDERTTEFARRLAQEIADAGRDGG